MKRLLLFALIVAAAWYGWKHHDDLRRSGAHEIVAVNHTGRTLERIRLSVAGESFAIETLAADATARLPLRADRDGTFDVVWNAHDSDSEKHWAGGSFAHGPLLMRHRLEFVEGDGIVYSSERIAAAR